MPHAATPHVFDPPARRGVLAGVVVVHLGAAWLMLQPMALRPAEPHAPRTLELFVVADTPARPLPPAAAARPARREPVVARAPVPDAPTKATLRNDMSPATSPVAASMPEPGPSSAPAPPPPAVAAAAPASDVVTSPRFDAAYLANPAPAYPPLARRAGEQGRVLLRVLVTADGLAGQVEVRVGSGSERLDEAARDAVRRWRFIPARRGSDPVAAWVVVPIDFRLDA